jgi:hypothetical protein
MAMDDDFEDDDEIEIFADYEDGEIGYAPVSPGIRDGPGVPALRRRFPGHAGPRLLQRLRRRDRGGSSSGLTGSLGLGGSGPRAILESHMEISDESRGVEDLPPLDPT